MTHISATKGAQDRCGHKKEEEKTVKLDICGDIEGAVHYVGAPLDPVAVFTFHA